MNNAAAMSYEQQLESWRSYLSSRPELSEDDVAELGDHLQTQVEQLSSVGLSQDESFVIAIRRMGSQSELAADFAQENAQEMWKQLVLGSGVPSAPTAKNGLLPMLGFAVVSGLVVLAGVQYTVADQPGLTDGLGVVALIALGVFASLGGYFSWLRGFSKATAVAIAIAAASTAVIVLYPFKTRANGYGGFLPADTQILAVLHLVVALLVLLGFAYLGAQWRQLERWLDYIRFVGEWVIYLVLIALGSGLLIGLTLGIFSLIGIDVEDAVTLWVIPVGFGGALVVAAWLVEAKKSVVENMAPVLTAIFTPLATLMLLAFLIGLAVSGNPGSWDRELLIVIDLLLALVWGLVLFSISARAADAKPKIRDWVQNLLVAFALVMDLVVQVAMAQRIWDAGLTPNRVAAIGENLVLAVNLAVALWLSIAFVRGKRSIQSLKDWQCRYLAVVGVWAVLVVVALPPLFDFI